MDKDIAIFLKNVSKSYTVRSTRSNTLREFVFNFFDRDNSKNEVKALCNVNISIKHGETVGIIGRNGSGKSTLLNIIMESIKPNKGGLVETKGKMIRLALGMGVDLNLSARDNIYVNGSVLGLSFKKIGKKFSEILDFSGLHEFVDTPVKFYSKGMKQRLLFSIALHADADVLLLDEFFAGTGDQDFKKKSRNAFKDKLLEGRTIIIVSHNLNMIKEHCNRVFWIDKGRIVLEGETLEVINKYSMSFERNK